MAGFVYFLPGAQGMSAELIPDGLKKIIGDRPVAWVGVGKQGAPGPDGGAGMLINPDDPDGPATGYYPKGQTWSESVLGPWWFGYANDNPPTPGDLKRPTEIKGKATLLGDGLLWTIPIARVFSAGSVLPHSYHLTKSGTLEKKILSEFVYFSEKAEEIYEAFCEQWMAASEKREPKSMLDDVECFIWSCKFLGMNYYVDADEVGAMKLFTPDAIGEILKVIIDVDAALDRSGQDKKKESQQELKNTSGGASDERPSIAQPTETS